MLPYAVGFVRGSHGDGDVWLFVSINAHGTVVVKDCFWHMFANNSVKNTHSCTAYQTPSNSNTTPTSSQPTIPTSNQQPSPSSTPPPYPSPKSSHSASSSVLAPPPWEHASKPYTASPCHPAYSTSTQIRADTPSAPHRYPGDPHPRGTSPSTRPSGRLGRDNL